MSKIKKLINEYLNTKTKKITAICIAVALVITCAGGVIYSLNKTPSLVLKKNKFTVEYGDPFNPDFKTLVDTKNLNAEDKHYLQHNTKIKSNIENEVETVINPDGTTSEKDRGFAKVGDYKITLTYQNEVVTVKVKVKDTVAPELTVPENVEIIQGTDLTTFDFKSLITATDLAQLNEIVFDTSTIDVNTLGEYTAKASVEDVNKNKTEKEFKVTVIAPPSVDSDEVIVQEEITNSDGTKTIKNTVKKKSQTSSSDGSNSNGSSSSKPSGGNSSGSSSGSGSSGGSSGGTGGSNSGNNGSSGGSGSSGSGGETKPEEPERPSPTTTYWVKCKLCGTLIESNVGLDDALNKLKSKVCEVDGYIYEGITAHSSYSYGSRQN